MIPRPSDRYRRPKNVIVIPDRVANRAATKYETSEGGCWISTYSVASHGYAQIGWRDGDHRHMVTPHVKKKMGGQTFGQVELGMPRHHKN